MIENEFPREFYINLEGADHLLGRITIHKNTDSFNSEVVIVLKESHKIWKYIGSWYGYADEVEAVDNGVVKIGQFIETSGS